MSRANDLEALKASAGDASSLMRALGNERRLLLLCLLVDAKELRASELAEAVGLSPSAASQHLAKMRAEGLVTYRRDAQAIYYRIGDPKVKRVIALLKCLYCP